MAKRKKAASRSEAPPRAARETSDASVSTEAGRERSVERGNVVGGNVPGGNVPGSNVPGGNVRVEKAAGERMGDPTAAEAPVPGPPDPERIAARAYELYQARGGGDGRALDDWLEAERELGETRRGEQDPSQ